MANEDNAFCYRNYCWVFDGATPIYPERMGIYETQAVWLSREFQAALKTGIDHYPDSPVCEVLEKSIEILIKNSPAAGNNAAYSSPVNVPSMTMALMNRGGGIIDMHVIGDCVIYLLTRRGKVLRFTDGRVSRFENKTVRVFNRYRNTPELKKRVTMQREKNKKMMNRPGGYWVVTPDKTWLDQVRRFSHNADDCVSALMCTDGFDRLFDLYRLIKPVEVLRQEISLEKCQEMLRACEQEDAECLRYPRLKVSDDSTAVLIEL